MKLGADSTFDMPTTHGTREAGIDIGIADALVASGTHRFVSGPDGRLFVEAKPAGVVLPFPRGNGATGLVGTVESRILGRLGLHGDSLSKELPNAPISRSGSAH